MKHLIHEVDAGVSLGPRRARLIGAAGCVVVVLGLLAFQMLEARASSGRTIGILTSSEPADGLLITLVEPGSPAELAGLQDGDLVTAVDGQPISSVTDYDVRAAQFNPGGMCPVCCGNWFLA